MKLITTDQLREKLANLKSCTAVAIETETIPRFNKTGTDETPNAGEPFPFEKGDISKLSVVSGLIGASYSNSVNNQKGREDKPLDFASL